MKNRLRAAVAALLLTLVPTLSWAQTGPRTVECELIVQGQTYIDDHCHFTPLGRGDFRITGNGYVAQVNLVAKGKARAFWNGAHGQSNAQGPLGLVHRDGACWIGPKVRICATNLSPGQLKTQNAKLPKGVMLYPDVPGGRSGCLRLMHGARVGSKVVLDRCELPRDLVFQPKPDGQIGILGHPDLCLGSGPSLALEICSLHVTTWQTRATATRSAPLVTSDDKCATIPDLAYPDALFPFFLDMNDCVASKHRALGFFMSKN